MKQCDVPAAIGIYALFLEGSCMYVGSSKNMQKRTSQHKSIKTFDDVRVIRCEPEELLQLEQEWIELLRPKLNKKKEYRDKNICKKRFLMLHARWDYPMEYVDVMLPGMAWLRELRLAAGKGAA